MTYFAALTGLLVGSGYGYIAQRGAFCMNSGFRSAVTERNTTKVKAYVLAIALQMLVVPLVFALGLSSPTYPAMFPIGAVVGGLLFGASMRWAGGCAAGVWYKVGSGSLGALTAVLGMAIGAAALELGPLVGLRTTVQSAGPSVSNAPLEMLWAWAPVAGVLLVARAVASRAGSGRRVVLAPHRHRDGARWDRRVAVVESRGPRLRDGRRAGDRQPTHRSREAPDELGRAVRAGHPRRRLRRCSTEAARHGLEGFRRERQQAFRRRPRSWRWSIASRRLHRGARLDRSSAPGARQHARDRVHLRGQRDHLPLDAARHEPRRPRGAFGLRRWSSLRAASTAPPRAQASGALDRGDRNSGPRPARRSRARREATGRRAW